MAPPTDLLVLLGDFNARVGCDWMTWEGVVGREGIDEINTSGYMLLEFCARNSLCVTNTFYLAQRYMDAPSLQNPSYDRLCHYKAGGDSSI